MAGFIGQRALGGLSPSLSTTQLDLKMRLSARQRTNTTALSRNVSAVSATGKMPPTELSSDATTWCELIKVVGAKSSIQIAARSTR
jgi:hypothetical protein